MHNDMAGSNPTASVDRPWPRRRDHSDETLIEKVAGKFDGSKYIARNTHIYEAGTDAMALAAADQEKYRQHIQAIADYIVTRTH